MITHYDLFAGIGGFSYALDQVFYDTPRQHIFCEWEAFPTAVLKKHWPDATYYGGIADLVADTNRIRERARLGEVQEAHGKVPERYDHAKPSNANSQYEFIADTASERLERSTGTELQGRGKRPARGITIVTGGFPCQPFSHAGRRQGTADDRYKWPEMFAVIRNVRPDWVIAENVRGLVTWNDGMVLETVCADLESEGYEVQPLVIPACAVGAPHRRDRVWIVAHNRRERWQQGSKSEPERTPIYSSRQSGTEWNKDWREVALTTCYDGVDDGLPRWMDGVTISAARHRKERLKACGNAIVPQVAQVIFSAIRDTMSAYDLANHHSRRSNY